LFLAAVLPVLQAGGGSQVADIMPRAVGAPADKYQCLNSDIRGYIQNTLSYYNGTNNALVGKRFV